MLSVVSVCLVVLATKCIVGLECINPDVNQVEFLNITEQQYQELPEKERNPSICVFSLLFFPSRRYQSLKKLDVERKV